MGYIATIACATLLEARRSRLLTLALLAMLSLSGLAAFLGELSITDAAGVKAAVTASALRVFCVCLVCLFVLGSGVRELHDKGMELVLSLPAPRSAWLFGKLAGYAALALCAAGGAGLLLVWYAPAVPVGCWALSLFCEQLLMVAFSLLCLLTFPNVAWSFMATMAFYLLARSMETIQLLGAAPLLASDAVAREAMYFLVNAMALLLPDLHAFTRSDWLLYGVAFNDVAAVMLQSLMYLAILTAAGLFDLYRRNF